MSRVDDFRKRLLEGTASLDTATGKELDLCAALVGMTRSPGEHDGDLRYRINRFTAGSSSYDRILGKQPEQPQQAVNIHQPRFKVRRP